MAGVAVLLAAVPVLAAEEAASWRPIWDTVWMWINFFILVFLIVKFGKEPLTDFLRGRREEIAKEIESLEWDKEKTTSALQETRQLITEGDAHIKTIKDRIVKEGERVKQGIIDDAKKQSEYMLEDARRKVKNQFAEAQKTFRADLINMAITAASEKAAAEINDDDQQHLLSYYFDVLANTAKLSA